MSDTAADRLLAEVWRSMRSALDALPPQRGAMVPLSRLTLEFWADSVAGARLLLAHPETTRLELVVGVAVASFLLGVAVGWATH